MSAKTSKPTRLSIYLLIIIIIIIIIIITIDSLALVSCFFLLRRLVKTMNLGQSSLVDYLIDSDLLSMRAVPRRTIFWNSVTIVIIIIIKNSNFFNNNKITLFIDSKKKIDYLQIQEYEY